jgi:hypothetical protein
MIRFQLYSKYFPILSGAPVKLIDFKEITGLLHEFAARPRGPPCDGILHGHSGFAQRRRQRHDKPNNWHSSAEHYSANEWRAQPMRHSNVEKIGRLARSSDIHRARWNVARVIHTHYIGG